MDLNLAGKRAIVTGASGASVFPAPKRWRRKGVEVVIVSRDAARLSAAREIWRQGPDLRGRPVESRGSAKLAAAHPAPDMVRQQRRRDPGGNLFDIDPRPLARGLAIEGVRLHPPTQLYLKGMMGGKSGRSSTIGLPAYRRVGITSAGRPGGAALIAFTRAIGGKSPDFGVRAVGINPGLDAHRPHHRPVEGAVRQKYDGDESRKRIPAAGLPFNRRRAGRDRHALANHVVLGQAGLSTVRDRRRRRQFSGEIASPACLGLRHFPEMPTVGSADETKWRYFWLPCLPPAHPPRRN